MREKIFLIPLISVLLLVMAGAGPPDAATELQQAETLFKNGQYDQAEFIYRQILAQQPGTENALEAQEKLTCLYIKQDMEDEAQASFEQLIADFSGIGNMPQSVYQIAEATRGLGKYRKANGYYQYVLDNWRGSEQAIWAQRGVAVSNIAIGDIKAAQAATDKLLREFSGSPNERMAKAVFEVADAFYWFKRYTQADDLYQYVLDNYPQVPHAMWAQMGLAISNVARGNDEVVEYAVERLTTDFSNDPNLAEALGYIAGRYEWDKRYEQAKDIYGLIANHYPESPQAHQAQLSFDRTNIFHLIESIDEADNVSAADAEVEEFLARYADHPALPENTYQIARCYERAESYDKAIEFHQYVIDRWTDSRFAILSRAGIALMDVPVGEDDASQAAIDDFIADFSDHPDLPAVLWAAAELYYNQAFFCENQGLDAQAVENFTKVTEVGRRILQQWPDSRVVAEVCHVLGTCCERQGQYAKAIEYYQKVVDNWPDYESSWLAQHRVAKVYKRLLRDGVVSDSEAEAAIVAAYEHLVETFPDCPIAHKARILLNDYHEKAEEGEEK